MKTKTLIEDVFLDKNEDWLVRREGKKLCYYRLFVAERAIASHLRKVVSISCIAADAFAKKHKDNTTYSRLKSLLLPCIETFLASFHHLSVVFCP